MGIFFNHGSGFYYNARINDTEITDLSILYNGTVQNNGAFSNFCFGRKCGIGGNDTRKDKILFPKEFRIFFSYPVISYSDKGTGIFIQIINGLVTSADDTASGSTVIQEAYFLEQADSLCDPHNLSAVAACAKDQQV